MEIEENIGEYFYNLGIRKVFLNMTPKKLKQ